MHVNNQEIKECVDLRACAYTNWYKKFRKITFESECIALPDEIVKYLLDEIIILPKECYSNDDDDAFGDDNGVDIEDNDDDEAEAVVSNWNSQHWFVSTIKFSFDILATGLFSIQSNTNQNHCWPWWIGFHKDQLE